MANILIVGCGDVGSRLALLLANDGHNVYGVRRSAHILPNVTMLQADISQPFSLPISDLDYAYIILSPDASNQAAYEKTFIDGVNHIRHSLESFNLKHVFFVSSTSVYGEEHGEWVDEDTPTHPKGFNGQVLCAAEALVQQYWLSSVVRFGGIYGEGRLRLMRWVESGKPVNVGQWTNRIHVADAAALLAFLLTQHLQGRELQSCYVGVDDYPCLQDEVLDWLAQELDLPPVPKLAGQGGANRRIANGRVKSLGFCFSYPSFREGYSGILG